MPPLRVVETFVRGMASRVPSLSGGISRGVTANTHDFMEPYPTVCFSAVAVFDWWPTRTCPATQAASDYVPHENGVKYCI